MPFDPQVQAIRDRLERERVPNLCALVSGRWGEAAQRGEGLAEPVT